MVINRAESKRAVNTVLALVSDEQAQREIIDALFASGKGWRKRNGVTTDTQYPNCGTRDGYQRHQRNGNDPCEPCTAANTKYSADRRGRSPRKLQPCGTPGAYQRHYKAGEPIDEDCRQAYNEYNLLKQRRYVGRKKRAADLAAKTDCVTAKQPRSEPTTSGPWRP